MENLDIKKYKNLKILSLLFLIFAIWRVVLFLMPTPVDDGMNWWSFSWGATYQLIGLFGAIVGFVVAKSWGGWKSMLGKVILAFSFGLLFQCLGQVIASIYVYHTGEVPYPGFDDIGFFGSVIFYIYGICLLAKVSGIRFSSISFAKKIQVFLFPIIVLIASYKLFLGGYEIDWTQKIRMFLDFGYPLGQAFYIAIAILTFLLSKKVLGGIMRRPIMLVIIALVLQYVADFTFLYQATKGLYIPEGINDLMYFVSYFFMSLSLIQLGIVFDKLKNS